MKKPSRYAPMKGYVRYSGMAFQMGIIIAGGTYGGVKLDQWLDTSPLFVIICALGSIAISMYLILKDFTSNKK